jgi:hypothetical protein
MPSSLARQDLTEQNTARHSYHVIIDLVVSFDTGGKVVYTVIVGKDCLPIFLDAMAIIGVITEICTAVGGRCGHCQLNWNDAILDGFAPWEQWNLLRIHLSKHLQPALLS